MDKRLEKKIIDEIILGEFRGREPGYRCERLLIARCAELDRAVDQIALGSALTAWEFAGDALRAVDNPGPSVSAQAAPPVQATTVGELFERGIACFHLGGDEQLYLDVRYGPRIGYGQKWAVRARNGDWALRFLGMRWVLPG